jgi:hypothetical protein
MRTLRCIATAILLLVCTLPDAARAADGAPDSPPAHGSATLHAVGAAAKLDAQRVGTAVKQGAKKTAVKIHQVALKASAATKRQAHKAAAFTQRTALKAKSAVTGKASPSPQLTAAK